MQSAYSSQESAVHVGCRDAMGEELRVHSVWCWRAAATSLASMFEAAMSFTTTPAGSLRRDVRSPARRPKTGPSTQYLTDFHVIFICEDVAQ